MRVRVGVSVALVGLVAAAFAAVGADPVSAGVSTDWKQLSAGRAHACGATTDGRLFCWGSDSVGQVGEGDDDEATEHRPVEVAGGITDWTQVSASFANTCAQKKSGKLFCWGDNDDGQLGTGGPADDVIAPQAVAGGVTS